jgi:hypothetical protein
MASTVYIYCIGSTVNKENFSFQIACRWKYECVTDLSLHGEIYSYILYPPLFLILEYFLRIWISGVPLPKMFHKKHVLVHQILLLRALYSKYLV